MYTIGMDSRDLTAAQADAILKRLAPMVCYLAKLRDRMGKRAFPPDDELFALAKQAHDAMHNLSIRTHYLSCRHGVGQPSGPKRKP
jgi:hypothetical protein